MKTYKELLEEKTRIRTTDLIRYNVLTLLLDGASKIAKKAMRDVSEEDIISAAKSEIKKSLETIELLKSKGALETVDVKQAEISIYQEFVPQLKSEDETKAMLQPFLDALPVENRNPKNMGKVIQYVKTGLGADAAKYDMGLVSKLIKNFLIN